MINEITLNNWRKKSIVKDVVFHGTNKIFDTFDCSRQLGSHFGTKKCAQIINKKKGGTLLHPVYILLQNPYRMDDILNFSNENLIKYFKDKFTDEDLIHIESINNIRDKHQSIKDVLIKMGHDGVVYMKMMVKIVI